MSFICKNTDCSASENKKGKVYPSAMECPFCDAPLVEVLSFNEADLKLINALPYVIAYPLKRAIAEKHACVSFPKVRPFEIRGQIKKSLILNSHEKIKIHRNPNYFHSSRA